MIIDLPDNHTALISFRHSADESIVIVSTVHDSVCVTADTLGFVIGHLVSKRLINPAASKVLIAYKPEGSVLESFYQIRVVGGTTMTKTDSGILPFAKTVISTKLDPDTYVEAVKISTTWQALRDTEVKLVMSGKIEAVTGKLLGVEKNGFILSGYDLPMKGTLVS